MLHFDNIEFDLGTVQYTQTKSVDVNITNNGPEAVTLQPANASCSCTTGHVEYSTLQPGAKGKFTISFNTNKSGKGANQARSIALNYTINRQTFSQIFRIKASVI